MCTPMTWRFPVQLIHQAGETRRKKVHCLSAHLNKIYRPKTLVGSTGLVFGACLFQSLFRISIRDVSSRQYPLWLDSVFGRILNPCLQWFLKGLLVRFSPHQKFHLDFGYLPFSGGSTRAALVTCDPFIGIFSSAYISASMKNPLAR